MASLWPRPNKADAGSGGTNGFEREGDKVYLAPEVLQGKYGKAADVFRWVFRLQAIRNDSHVTLDIIVLA